MGIAGRDSGTDATASGMRGERFREGEFTQVLGNGPPASSEPSPEPVYAHDRRPTSLFDFLCALCAFAREWFSFVPFVPFCKPLLTRKNQMTASPQAFRTPDSRLSLFVLSTLDSRLFFNLSSVLRLSAEPLDPLHRMCINTHMERKKIIKLLEKEGWLQVAQSGSHVQFRHPYKKGRITVPHPKKDIPVGT
jgi:predicted RNA binding protein YcfA (HicA-like mRNA interferase family)